MDTGHSGGPATMDAVQELVLPASPAPESQFHPMSHVHENLAFFASIGKDTLCLLFRFINLIIPQTR